MKRTLILIALAILLSASPADAQKDGEWQIKNEKSHATGEATNGTCSPENFPFEFDLRLGPGTKAVTSQGDQKTTGRLDPDTGTIRTSNDQESKVLKLDGPRGLTGVYTYQDCRWRAKLKLDKPALTFVKNEAPAEAAASPSAEAGGAPAGAAGAANQQEEEGSFPWWLAIVGAGFVLTVMGFLWQRHAGTTVGTTEEPAELPWRCLSCGHEATKKEFFQREVFSGDDDDDDDDEEDYEPVYEPADSPMCPRCGETEAVGEGAESILDEVDPPRVIA